MKILILEDEVPAYEKLLDYITEELENAQLIGWCRSNKEALQVLRGLPGVDLIFSDIELLDGTAFNTFEQVPVTCPIIFCTAFDQYVLKAFQTNGIAYLLKPYTLESFREAMKKYHTLFQKPRTDQLPPQLLQEFKAILQADKQAYRRRFTIKKKEGIKLLDTEDITYFEAQGDFCLAIDKHNKKHVINMGLSAIEEQLDPSQFFRINRSQVIQVTYIDHIEPHFKNKLAVRMRPSQVILQTSSSKTPAFRKWLEQ